MEKMNCDHLALDAQLGYFIHELLKDCGRTVGGTTMKLTRRVKGLSFVRSLVRLPRSLIAPRCSALLASLATNLIHVNQ